jgi:hypothetical protein
MAAFSRAALGVALLLPSCFDPGEGVEPPLNRIYFPVGLALNTRPLHGAKPAVVPTQLYLVNSDFDLQFNGGTVQSYALDRMYDFVPTYCTTDLDCTHETAFGKQAPCQGSVGKCKCAATHPEPPGAPGAPPWCVERLDEPCGPLGTKSGADRTLSPGLCRAVNVLAPQDGQSALQLHSVKIGAFATDVIYREPRDGPAHEGRLFVPVRGDSTLHWIDVHADGGLDCGQSGANGCDGRHRAGDNPADSTRGLRLTPEPFGIDATDAARAIVLTHQTQGAVSLFIQDPDPLEHPELLQTQFVGAPRLEFIEGGLPRAAIDIAAVPPPPDADRAYEPGFLVTFRNAPEIDLLRYTADTASDPHRPFLWNSGAAPIRANSLGFDSRGIAVDAGERADCKARGESSCGRYPLGVYAANRTPETLLVGHTTPDFTSTGSTELPSFSKTVDLPSGPSRVVIGKIVDVNGNLATRVFVVCFDSHSISGYDPVTGDIDTRIQTGRGPHALVIDADVAASPRYSLGYVAHFTDSYIGVIDLDQRHTATYGTIVVTLGQPTAPRAQK